MLGAGGGVTELNVSAMQPIIRANIHTDANEEVSMLSGLHCLTCGPALLILQVAVFVVVCVGGFGRRFSICRRLPL